MKEFYVQTCNANQATGYCGGNPIIVGDIFTRVQKRKDRVTLDQLKEPPVTLTEKTVKLTVVKIYHYGEQRGLIEKGQGGLLYLSGEYHVKPGEVLTT